MADSAVTQVGWNVSQYKISLIGEQVKIAIHYYMQRNYVASFMAWKSIRLLINNRLDKKEKAFIKNFEINVFKKAGYITIINGKKTFKLNPSKIAYFLDTYCEHINHYMKKHGFDIPDKNQKSLF